MSNAFDRAWSNTLGKEGGGRPLTARRLQKLKFIEQAARSTDATMCIEWPWGRAKTGYGVIRFGSRTLTVHRLVLAVRLGRDLSIDEQAIHRCDNRPCINGAHLQPATNAENVADMVRKGRHRFPTDMRSVRAAVVDVASGERHGRAKLSWADVDRIRELYRRGMSQRAIGKLFSVTQFPIRRIVTGNGWKRRAAA